MPTTAAMMMFRRRCERSTTTSVSEPCETSFPVHAQHSFALFAIQAALAAASCITRISHSAATAPPHSTVVPREFLLTAAPAHAEARCCQTETSLRQGGSRQAEHREMPGNDRKITASSAGSSSACLAGGDRQAADARQGPGRLHHHHPARHRRRPAGRFPRPGDRLVRSKARPPASSPPSSAPSSSCSSTG